MRKDTRITVDELFFKNYLICLCFRWEASYALRKRLAEAGYHLQGAPGGWGEMIRVMRECRVCLLEYLINIISNLSL